jgi:alkyldihydroxyacetonephosphate synthase
MRRWNGWGDDSVHYPLPPMALQFLESLIGRGEPSEDASLDDIAASAPPSRLIKHPLIADDSAARVLHARGQSTPDWIAMRSGLVGAFPDGVAYPTTRTEVEELVRYTLSTGAHLIPYGGGTSVVGHINPVGGQHPVLTVDLGRLNRMLALDGSSMLATFECGVTGPYLEAQLRARGFTLGHYPQSFELSTLGGWIASRSSGQQSLRYGRIEKLFAGGRLVSPAGVLDLPAFPASAAGPDLREIVLGSEGRIGILTEATVRISPLPEREAFHGIFFPDFDSGCEAARRIVQSGAPLAMLRFSTASETTTTLALAGHENLVGILESVLSVRGLGPEKCLLLVGFSGRPSQIRLARNEVLEISKQFGGVHVGRTFGEQWHNNRFRTPYLRNTLWDLGYAVDTLETATDWTNLPETLTKITSALNTALTGTGERVHVFSHLSHLYPYGSSIYITYVFRLARDPQETLDRWHLLKDAASQAVVDSGGTISHQHGVGLDHRPYLPAEKGSLGMAVLSQVARTFDPAGIMNPGKLLQD